METNNKKTNDKITVKLEELKNATKESIENKKKYDYKIGKGLEEKLGDEKDTYYEKYLRKSVGEKIPPIFIKKKGDDKKGKEVCKGKTKRKGKERDDKITYAAMPIHHYNTLLAMAFTKGEKLYSMIRGKIKEESGKYETKAKVKEIDGIEEEGRGLSAIEYLLMSRHLFSGKNSNIKLAVKKGQTEMLEEYAKNEKLIYKVLEELRNYHSHIFHEPGPVSFKNLYGDDYKPKKKLNEEDWAKARDWFMNKFNDAKEHKLKTLDKVLERELTDKEKEDTQKVIERIKGYQFEYNGYVSREALLFIACMFLRKSDAAYFTKKWTGMKIAEGVFKSTQSFFTDNALKESKSVLILNADLYKYRQIIGILSTMPEMKTERLKPFYDFIREKNKSYFKKAESVRKKEEKEKNQSFIIPTRKTGNYTYWYMKYLNDNKLLNGFRIAYYKTPEERTDYLKVNKITSPEELKLKMKQATGEEKKRLTEIFKETQRNFIFKEPTIENDNFCVKKLNVFFQYDFDYNGKNVTVQMTISPDFLMKWVFVHLIKGNDKEVKESLNKYVEVYYKRCLDAKFKEPLFGIEAKKVFPGSLTNTVENEEIIESDKIVKRIKTRYDELNKFNEENKSRIAPWRFGSKRKIDIIMDYVHLIYLDRAYDEKKTVDKIRHESLNDTEYLDAFEMLRYFGRYSKTPEFGKIFFEDKKIYFSPISKAIKQLDSLEGIYNFAIERYMNYLKDVIGKVTESNNEKYSKVFKITGKSLSSKVKHHSEMFAVNHCVPHELIKLDEVKGYLKWKNDTKEKQWISDFSFIRQVLEERGGFSNTDYLMKEIMPIILKKKKIPEKENGKIKGNQQMYNALARNKTNELMLWEIGKHYWKKATRNDFARSFRKLELNSRDEIKSAYRKTNPFYTIFQEELEIKLQKNQQSPLHIIKIKPKKFDDEYQYYESEHIIDYIENYAPPKSEDGFWHFEEINKNIKDELTKYLDDVYLLMTAEKYVIKNNFEEYAALLKLIDSELPEYHIAFDGKNVVDKEKALNKVIYKSLKHNNSFNEEDLNIYRNKVMHQQLQTDKGKYREIRKSLIEYCIKNKLLN